jgi:hypothetical protein
MTLDHSRIRNSDTDKRVEPSNCYVSIVQRQDCTREKAFGRVCHYLHQLTTPHYWPVTCLTAAVTPDVSLTGVVVVVVAAAAVLDHFPHLPIVMRLYLL